MVKILIFQMAWVGKSSNISFFCALCEMLWTAFKRELLCESSVENNTSAKPAFIVVELVSCGGRTQTRHDVIESTGVLSFISVRCRLHFGYSVLFAPEQTSQQHIINIPWLCIMLHEHFGIFKVHFCCFPRRSFQTDTCGDSQVDQYHF